MTSDRVMVRRLRLYVMLVSMFSSSSRVLHVQSQTSGGCPPLDENPWCPCYNFEEGLFLECPGTTLSKLQEILDMVSAPIKSLSVYHLEENITHLPGLLFANVTVQNLQISYSSLETLSDDAFGGLEQSLESVSIMNSRLQKVPQAALQGLTKLRILDLDSNEIVELPSYCFYNMHLISLNLQGNNISTVSEYAFAGLENTLAELALINNKLGTVPLKALRRLRKLETLRLVWNGITSIPDDGFTKLTSLQRLDLSSNKIDQLNDKSFATTPQLLTLSLFMNQISALDEPSAFRHLLELETIDLGHNSVRSLSGHIFQNNRKLRTVDVTHNHLHGIEVGVFHNLPFLREVFLANNNILRITNTTFVNSSQVSVLYLHNNAIKCIEGGAFQGIGQLLQLQLSFNRIQEFHTSLFKTNRELRSLSADHNRILDIVPGTFQELVELRDLRLQNNLLKRIRKGSFYSLPRLLELHLQNNRIEVIEQDAFQSLSNLQHLSLDGNRLLEVAEILNFPATSNLQSLQLDRNQVTFLHNASFRGLEILEILRLNYNKQLKLRRGVFQDLIRTQKLYLDHNQVASIEEGTFDSLSGLTFLDLDNNNLDKVTSSMFRGAINLEELYLSNNVITEIEPQFLQLLRKLKKLDLSNNQIFVLRKHMFEGAISLQELILQNCMIEEVETDALQVLPSLSTLNLRDNHLHPHKLDWAWLPNLQTLVLSQNNLSSLGPQGNIFSGLQNLVHLELTEVELSSLDDTLFAGLGDLQTLRLVGNNIASLPKVIFGALRSLRELFLDENKLTAVPKESLQRICTNVEVISLARNAIVAIWNDSFAGHGQQLRKLDLSGNRIASIDAEAFVNLTHLNTLELSQNLLRSLPANVFDHLTSLQRLNLSNNKFNFITSSLYVSHLPSLQTLLLEQNPMVKLREDLNGLAGLTSVQELKITGTNLTIVTSQDLVDFASLKSLVLSANRISKISPGAFKTLQSLELLNLSDNDLEILPQERLHGLTTLNHLDLCRNRLSAVPDFPTDQQSNLLNLRLCANQLSVIHAGHLDNLQSLQTLDLSGNLISFVANDAFRNLTALTDLDLSFNKLTTFAVPFLVPVEIRLTSLFIHGNPLACSCDAQDLWDWLQDHLQLLPTDTPDKTLTCSLPAKLFGQSFVGLEPASICPVPIVTLLEAVVVQEHFVIVRWDVRHEAKFGGFRLIYYPAATSTEGDNSAAIRGSQKAAINADGGGVGASGDKAGDVVSEVLGSSDRQYKMDSLRTDTEYEVCVVALSDYANAASKVTPFSVDTHLSSRKRVTSTPNQQCRRLKTLHGRTKGPSNDALVTHLSTIIGASVGAAVVLILAVTVTAIKFHKKKRRKKKREPLPQEYISYRHFSIQSSDGVYTTS